MPSFLISAEAEARALFYEHFTNSPAKMTVTVLAFAIMTAGVTALSRAAPQDLAPSAAVAV